MGEYAELIISGDICAECSRELGPGDGFSCVCASCETDGSGYRPGDEVAVLPGPPRAKKKPCPHCGKLFRGKQGVLDHVRDMHKPSMAFASPTPDSIIDFNGLPAYLVTPMQRYILRGVDPGGFLADVLRRDLRAVLRADPRTLRLVPDILAWCIRELPPACWGSRHAYDQWVAHMGEIGIEAPSGQFEVWESEDGGTVYVPKYPQPLLTSLDDVP